MSESTDEVRLGIIGAAGRTGRQFLAASDGAAGAVVAGVADLARGQCRQLAKRWGAKYYGSHARLLESEDVDAVVVCTPPSRRPRLAQEAISSRKPVLLPLPIAASVAEADALLHGMEPCPSMVTAASAYRHIGRAQVAAQAIRGSQIGPVRSAIDISTSYVESTWAEQGGGILMGQAAYRLDLLVWLLGTPKQVSAKCWPSPKTGSAEQVVTAVLDYGDGSHAMLHVRPPVWSEPHRLEVFGERGRLVMDATVRVERYTEQPQPCQRPEQSSRPAGHGDDVHEGLVAAVSDFATSVRGGDPPRVSVADGAASLEVANALILASHTGSEISLPVDRQLYAKLLREMRKGERAAVSP